MSITSEENEAFVRSRVAAVIAPGLVAAKRRRMLRASCLDGTTPPQAVNVGVIVQSRRGLIM